MDPMKRPSDDRAVRAIADTSRYDAPTEERDLDARCALAAMGSEGLIVIPRTEVERLRDLVATLWLYIGRYEVTQLTTEQKELLADCVEAHFDDGVTFERWWRNA